MVEQSSNSARKRILFTGASSFTGMWFVQALAAAGHDVVVTFRRSIDQYDKDPLLKQRVARALGVATDHITATFGDDAFLDAIRSRGPFDVLCHHAAEVANYRSPDFDVTAALAHNTHRLPEVLASLSQSGCQTVILTGSIFEPGEGVGSDGLPAINPYGLSKGLTSQVFEYRCRTAGLTLGKFVIPNPFGPYENSRLTDFLMQTWLRRESASIRTPDYVRDNIHVTLLAKAYAQFTADVANASTSMGTWRLHRCNPCGYVETVNAFADRFAQAMRSRLQLPCELDLDSMQMEWHEPLVRFNTDHMDHDHLGWNEHVAWDELVSYYQTKYDIDR